TRENRIEGALIIVVDVDPFKKGWVKAEQERDLLYAIIHAVPEPMLVLEQDLRVKMANESFLRKFHVRSDDTEGRLIYDLGNRQWDIPDLRRLLEDVLPKNYRIEDFKVEHDFLGIGHKIMILSARQISHADVSRPLILLSIEDVTEHARSQEEIYSLNTSLERRV